MGKHSYNTLEYSASEHLPLQFDITSVLTLGTDLCSASTVCLFSVSVMQWEYCNGRL
ncbi:hypothetical protein L917_14834 [Phytophthora nicotianae]|uniref:Uncharacterized protein n=1 Tax=Phytophthora nicotianae TaxID=4792 RepID=W2KM32_PHYNI|nr:hypothetical protein L916_15008 [Phytophthora nicotianae]ETL85669.1 hypothetical protein L917_14834 [Phytophthora nicotianae]